MIISPLSPVGHWLRFENALNCMQFIFVMYHAHHLAPHHVFFLILFPLLFLLSLLLLLQLFFCLFFLFFQSCMLIWWLSFHFSVDVWSVGCIMAEMVRGSVLFPGTDRILKLNLHSNPKMLSCLILCLTSCSYLGSHRVEPAQLLRLFNDWWRHCIQC